MMPLLYIFCKTVPETHLFKQYHLLISFCILPSFTQRTLNQHYVYLRLK